MIVIKINDILKTSFRLTRPALLGYLLKDGLGGLGLSEIEVGAVDFDNWAGLPVFEEGVVGVV